MSRTSATYYKRKLTSLSQEEKTYLSAQLTENSINIRLRGKLMIPLRLAKPAANPMNRSEAFEVADGDFVGWDSDNAAEFLVQVVDVEGSSTGHDGELERESGESGMPWSWERAERVSDAFVEELRTVNMAFGIETQQIGRLPWATRLPSR
jgi:hypothetical protein